MYAMKHTQHLTSNMPQSEGAAISICVITNTKVICVTRGDCRVAFYKDGLVAGMTLAHNLKDFPSMEHRLQKEGCTISHQQAAEWEPTPDGTTLDVNQNGVVTRFTYPGTTSEVNMYAYVGHAGAS